MTASITSTEEKAVVRKITLRIIPFVFLLYIISYLDRANIDGEMATPRAARAAGERAHIGRGGDARVMALLRID